MSLRRYSTFPKSVAKSIEPLLQPIYKKHGFAEHRILTQWNNIVGEELAGFSIPQKLVFSSNTKEQGVLHVLISSARTLELQHMQPVILDKITTYFGYPAVARLKFIQTSGQLFRKSKPKTFPTNDRPQVPFIDCEDKELYEALLSLGKVIIKAD